MKLDKLEYPEARVVKMTFSATAEELETASQAVYERTRETYRIKGFEKGQADRAAIEAERGEHTFWYDAINDIMDRDVAGLMDKASKENKLDPVGEPAYDLVSVKKDEGFVATATLALRPELTLGQYTGFSVKSAPVPVEEKEIDQYMERRQSEAAKLVPHKGPAVKGNTVHVDYKGTIDGKAFDGGEAKNTAILLGKGHMIPGFEDGILGHIAGDEFDLSVTFPEKYFKKELAGKPAVFHIVLHDVCISQKPSLNSDFAKEAGKVDTMDEFRANVRTQMEQARLSSAQNRGRTLVLNALGDATKGDIPTVLIDQEYTKQLNNFQMQLQMMRMPMSAFLQHTRQSKDDFLSKLREGSERALRTGFALKMISDKENLAPTAEDLAKEYEGRAERAKTTVEEYKKKMPEDRIREIMVRQRASNFVVEHSTIDTSPAPAPKTK